MYFTRGFKYRFHISGSTSVFRNPIRWRTAQLRITFTLMCKVGEKYSSEAKGYFTVCNRRRSRATPKNEQHALISQSPGRQFDGALPLLHVLTDTDNLGECEIIRWKKKNLKVLRQSRKIESDHAAATIPRTMKCTLPRRELSCKALWHPFLFGHQSC